MNLGRSSGSLAAPSCPVEDVTTSLQIYTRGVTGMERSGLGALGLQGSRGHRLPQISWDPQLQGQEDQEVVLWVRSETQGKMDSATVVILMTARVIRFEERTPIFVIRNFRS